MHYYDFHIADYRKDTQHLSPIEHYIYRSLIDWYFLDESPITQNNPTVIRRLSLGSTPDAEALINGVFADFFELKDGFWHHRRIDSMLAGYQAKAEANRKNGKKGGRPPKKEAKTAKTEPKITQSVIFANPSESESNPNQEPITNNQEPITNNQNTPPLPPDGGPAGPQNKKPEKPKSEESEAGFEKFWQVWPKSDRKQAKGLCLKAWKKAGAERHAADILAHIEACKRSENWSKEGGQFIPAPLVYLNQKRWEGAELAESVAAGGSKFGSGFEGVM